MAQMPIEVIEVVSVLSESLSRALQLANSVQNEFVFSFMPDFDPEDFAIEQFYEVKTEEFMNRMERLRADIGGYHPFLIAFVDSELEGKDGMKNIFGSNRPENGLAVFTISNVPDNIVPRERMVSYFLYYLAKSTLTFIVPSHKNHKDTRSCVFDRKLYKPDLLESMRARAFCDACRGKLSEYRTLSRRQFSAVQKMFEMCGRLLEETPEAPKEVEKRPRAFIGSSTQGLAHARALKELLKDDLAVTVWDEGTVFGLGDANLEALEQAVLTYEFGIFVFTPDDEVRARGETNPVARDNVIFEAGLFIGKLTRRRAFVVHPSGKAIVLPTDLLGITTAQYDPRKSKLEEALVPARDRIRAAVARTVLA